jgi:hypothetical protein
MTNKLMMICSRRDALARMSRCLRALMMRDI